MRKGNIKDIEITKLIESVLRQHSDGHIIFKLDESIKKIYFEKNHIASSASNDPTDYLGQYLINEGIISLEQFNRAYRTELETDVKMGAILKLIGLAPLDKLAEALISKIIDTAFIVSCWGNGEYEISDEYPLTSSRVEIKLTSKEINNYLIARQKELPEITEMYRKLGSYPEISILDKNIHNLKRLDQQIINLLSIGKTLEEVIDSLPVHFYLISRHLFHLYKENILLPGTGNSIDEAEFFSRLTVTSGITAPTEIAPISSEEMKEIYRLAEEATMDHNYWKAASYYRVLRNINPHNIVFRDALNNAEYNYIVFFYKEIFSPSTYIMYTDGSGAFSDPFEEQIIMLLRKNAYTIRDLVNYFSDRSPEVKVLHIIERLKNKGYITIKVEKNTPKEKPPLHDDIIEFKKTKS